MFQSCLVGGGAAMAMNSYFSVGPNASSITPPAANGWLQNTVLRAGLGWEGLIMGDEDTVAYLGAYG